MERAIAVGRKNLTALERILYFNAAHGVRLFRLSSQLIPLATHPDVGIDVANEYRIELNRLGAFARKHHIRLSMHPDQFTVLNGGERVVEAANHNLDYHAAILDGMGLDESGLINIHVGGAYGDKSGALQRLYATFPSVSPAARNRLSFENDDKTYTLEETLEACERLRRPLVLDLHHDWCNPSSRSPLELLPRIQATWGGLSMKIHVSSPKNQLEFRSHADYIDPGLLLVFLRGCRESGMQEINVMIEAKRKDYAMFRLAEDLAQIRGIQRVDGTVLAW